MKTRLRACEKVGRKRNPACAGQDEIPGLAARDDITCCTGDEIRPCRADGMDYFLPLGWKLWCREMRRLLSTWVYICVVSRLAWPSMS